MASEDDHDLLTLAESGMMDYTRWPGLLERAIPRLNQIVYNDFPIPSIPVPETSLFGVKEIEAPSREGPPEKRIKLDDDRPETSTTEEKVAPTDSQESHKSNEEPSTLASTDTAVQSAKSLPPALLALLSTISTTLQNTFPTSPPHTAQRLAELLLYPKQHYSTLPSYLRAFDRIVSVASPASVFPLPNIQSSSTANGALLNGTVSNPPSPNPGDTDFIGGAELTEIPWLRDGQGIEPAGSRNGKASDLRTESTSLIDGPHGAGSVETVTVNVNGISSVTTKTAPREESTATTSSPSQPAVTQGELLRQEQEAGVVPVPLSTHTNTSGRVTRASTAASQAALRATGMLPSSDEETDEVAAPPVEEEKVHVRGPDVIGMEDMGPQAPGSGLEDGINVEGALGRPGEAELAVDASSEEGPEKEARTGANTGVTVSDEAETKTQEASQGKDEEDEMLDKVATE